ncbi:Stage III sporulation protein AF [uncultured Eubacteriales bacterium]|uniref:Stage III sporulation protein AF n=1 Tax=uncultured Eubacteriales bacterium TaxID=172733 RepID=A0A212JVW7_9FIRM|nr:Stage III sporulation protein AF [uncultured Eubacteriales bacterium]
MIELIRSWLVGITCAAMIVALAESLSPAGAVHKVGRLTGGLVLLLAILRPVAALDLGDLSGILAQYRVEAAGYSTLLDDENERLMKAIIEEETSAYILDKAAVLGIEDCTVTVAVADGERPVPEAVTVMGSLTENQQRALSRQIEADLAIPEERQTYRGEDVE